MENISGMLNEFTEKTSLVLGMSDIKIAFGDVVEILIISFLFYHVLLWIKNTRAWNLFKGIVIILIFVAFAAVFQMTTILWLAQNLLNVGLIALVIIFQPELRKALDQLGRKSFLGMFTWDLDRAAKKFSERTASAMVKATFEMATVKTGANSCWEGATSLCSVLA